MQQPGIKHRSLQTREQQGLIRKWSAAEENSLALYRLAVKMHSEHNYRKYFSTINPEQKKRSKYQYHLDHIFPVIAGWLQGVDPKLIAHPKNLQLLWCTDNIVKGARVDFSLEDFYQSIGLSSGGVMSERTENAFSLNEDF